MTVLNVYEKTYVKIDKVYKSKSIFIISKVLLETQKIIYMILSLYEVHFADWDIFGQAPYKNVKLLFPLVLYLFNFKLKLLNDFIKKVVYLRILFLLILCLCINFSLHNN